MCMHIFILYILYVYSMCVYIYIHILLLLILLLYVCTHSYYIRVWCLPLNKKHSGACIKSCGEQIINIITAIITAIKSLVHVLLPSGEQICLLIKGTTQVRLSKRVSNKY